MSQLVYNFDMPLGLEGMRADSETALIESRWIATGIIPFGRAVVKVTGEDYGITLPSAATPVFHGVSMMTQASEQALTTGIVQYENTEPVNVMRKGKIWVFVEEAVDPDTDVPFYRYATGSATVIGRFRTDIDSTTALAVPNARFVTSTTGAGLAVLEINNL